MDKADSVMQEKMAMSELMGCAGMKVFKADLSDDMSYVINEIGKVTKKSIDQKDLSLLNYNLGLKAGLEMALNRLANYEDDLIGDDVKPPKK